MADYELYYWPVPFRGQFLRAVLAFAGKRWTETDPAALEGMMEGSVGAMPVPFMGPPVLVDTAAGFALAQMPAIVLYLGETLRLMPATPAMRALTLKIVLDANDVIDELTLDGGRQMWTSDSWQAFQPRLQKWMTLWEETGRRHGLTATGGTLLGTEAPGLADVVTFTLWGTMGDRLPALRRLLEETAPSTAALVKRMLELPALTGLEARARRDWGDAYCGGDIEASIRAVLDA